MNQGLKKGLIWGLTLTAIGVGTYYLLKSLGKLPPFLQGGNQDNDEDDVKFQDENVYGEDVLGYSPPSTPPKKKTDVYRWLSKGKRDSDTQNEIEKLQYIINRMRLAAFTVKANKSKYDNLSQDFKNWVNKMTEKPSLVVDGVFGDKTEALTYIAMGFKNKGTNLCNARKRRQYVNKSFGLYDPYAKWATVCGKY